jgi:hypothetical protein
MFSQFFGNKKNQETQTLETIKVQNSNLMKENEKLLKEIEILKEEVKMYQNLMFTVKLN